MNSTLFTAVHRGGKLDMQRHRMLAAWAAGCARHVLGLFEAKNTNDKRPRTAILAARAWARGKAAAGASRAAALAAHGAARDAAGEPAHAAARAAGHAAATAHMARHAIHAAEYAVRAVRAAAGMGGGPAAADRERTWQRKKVPEEIRELVLTAFTVTRGKGEAHPDSVSAPQSRHRRNARHP
jgi:hypothetical protein